MKIIGVIPARYQMVRVQTKQKGESKKNENSSRNSN